MLNTSQPKANNGLAALRTAPSTAPTLQGQRGFTLVEMLTVMVIVSILVGVGLPSLQTSIGRNNVVASANRLIGSINFARSQAVNKQQIVTLEIKSATAGDWSEGWTVYSDAGREGLQPLVIADGDVWLKDIEVTDRGMTVNAGAAAQWISFNSRGQSFAATTIALCDSTDDNGIPGTTITLSLVGRTTVATIASANKATAGICNPP